MTSPYNFASEVLFPGTSQASTTPSVYAEIAFRDTSVSLPCCGPDHSLSNFASGFDPLTLMPWLPDNYFPASPPTVTQPQQNITSEWVGNNTTHEAAFNMAIDANATAMSYGKSPLVYPTQPSQSLRRVSTEPHSDIGITQELDSETFYLMSPARSPTYVSSLSQYDISRPRLVPPIVSGLLLT
ncbi:hypothetical protein DPV78_001735 [Talaromyces pinophilus]|nr:hypothetical protein DPV78_001735 [Talaromyces pinophilus]